MPHSPGPAWFRHRMDARDNLRIELRGWFTPLHGTVLDVQANRVLIQPPNIDPRWITVAGPKNQVRHVSILTTASV